MLQSIGRVKITDDAFKRRADDDKENDEDLSKRQDNRMGNSD